MARCAPPQNWWSDFTLLSTPENTNAFDSQGTAVVVQGFAEVNGEGS